MKTKKIEETLDANLFSSKLFKKAYIFYAFWFLLSPIIEVLFACVGLEVLVMLQMMLVSMFFIFTKFFELIFNFRKINLKNGTLIDLMLVVLLVWILISTIITKTFNFGFVFAVCYFAIACLFLNVDKKYYKKLAIVFICEMVFDSLLALIDLENKFIPGLNEETYAMSMQFYNPNWSASIVIIAEILTLYFLCKFEKVWQKSLLFAGFVVMTVGLFVGGSYAPETALFLCELALVIYLWVRYKKCPWWILLAFISTIVISFAVWWVPAFRNVTTANANYFYESLAVIDGELGTHLVRGVSTFFDKLFGWGVFGEVAGSDGWGRVGYMEQAYNAIFASPKTFFFGNGCSYINVIRVHNCYMVIWMEFGIVAILSYLAIFAMLLVRFIKIKKTSKEVFLFSGLVMMLFESLFCCIEPFCYPFMVVFFVIVYKVLYSAEPKQTVEKSKENISK